MVFSISSMMDLIQSIMTTTAAAGIVIIAKINPRVSTPIRVYMGLIIVAIITEMRMMVLNVLYDTLLSPDNYVMSDFIDTMHYYTYCWYQHSECN